MNEYTALNPSNDRDGLPHPATALMLHCSASSGGQWKHLQSLLPGWCESLAPNQFGCGETSPWPGQEAFSLSSEAKPIVDLIEKRAGPIHVIGHSYGGALALHIAQSRPHLVSSLTLIEPSAFHLLRQGNCSDQARFGEIYDIAQAVNEAILSGDFISGARSFVDYWNGQGSWHAASENARQEMVRGIAKIALDFRALFVETTGLNDFSLLPIPTKIIRGTRSPDTSLRIVDLLNETLPFVCEDVVEGAGHMSPFTHRTEVDKLIYEHMLHYSQHHIKCNDLICNPTNTEQVQ